MAALGNLFTQPTMDHPLYGQNVIVLDAPAHQQLSALLKVKFAYLREGLEELNTTFCRYLPA